MSNELVTAQQQILALMEALDVARIIWVDDQFAISSGMVSSIIDYLQDIGLSSDAERIIGLVLDEHGDWRVELDAYWEGLTADECWGIFCRLVSLGRRNTQRLVKDWFDNRVQLYCTKRITVERYPPGLWHTVEGELDKWLNDPNNTGRVLCLFDQELTGDGHTERTDGMELIRTYQARRDDGRVICALLSKTFKKNEELTEGRKLAETHKVDLNTFMPLSKERLDSPFDFADGLRLTFLMLSCARLAREVALAAVDSTTQAKSDIDRISIYDFRQIVLETSHQEGIWEAETLLRLFGIYHDSYMRRAVYANRSVLNRWARNVRQFIRSDGAEMDAAQRSGSWQHSRMEYYDFSAELNSFLMPIELGDIFEVGEEHHFLAIGQPCDLAIRTTGTRTSVDINLVRVSFEGPAPNQSEVVEKLPFFGKDGRPAYVYLKESSSVPLILLDLAAYHTCGKADFDLTDTCPAELHGALQKRFAALAAFYTSEAARLNTVREHLNAITSAATRDNLWQSQIPSAKLEGLTSSYDGNRFSYGIKRVGRCRPQLALNLLHKWGAVITRPALEREFVG